MCRSMCFIVYEYCVPSLKHWREFGSSAIFTAKDTLLSDQAHYISDVRKNSIQDDHGVCK